MSATMQTAAPGAERDKREVLRRLLRERAKKTTRQIPLTDGQKALWFLNCSAPRSAAYHVGFTMRIRSAIDVGALQRALQHLVDRHPMLRATFPDDGGLPDQVVAGACEVSFTVVDASSWEEAQLMERTKALYEEPFSLSRGPLFRAHLLHLGERDAVLLLTVHHLVYDAWSLWLTLDELRALYVAQSTGKPANLQALARTYESYVEQERQTLAGPAGERLWAYWREQLDGASTPLALPTDRPRPSVQRFRGASCSFRLAPELAGALKDLARRQGVTSFSLLLAVYQVLLSRYSGQEDLLVGTPTSGGKRSQYPDVVGYFVNQVPVRAQLGDRPRFTELLSRTRDTLFEALEHQEFPFSRLVERLSPKRDTSYAPLVQVSFVYQQAQRTDGIADLLSHTASERMLGWGGLEVEYFPMAQQEGQFDLELEMMEGGGQFFGLFKYDRDLFDPGTIARMVGHLENLLADVVSDPERTVDRLQMLGDEERRQVVVGWNDTATDNGHEVCLHRLCEAQARRTPEATAVVFEGTALTYRELNQRANRLAHALRSWGVGPDVLVGITVERSLEMVVGLLAILKAGGAYVPIDPSYPRDRVEFMLADSGVAVLLTQSAIRPHLPPTPAHVFCLDSDWEQVAESDPDNPVHDAAPEHLAYVIYTSGSTGRPKGAMNTHRAICNRLLWMQDAYGLTPSDRVLQKTPFSFDVSVWEFFWPLMTGARLVVARPGGHQDRAYLAATIAEERITTVHFVPSMLQVFLEQRDLGQCDSVRQVICSGEALSAELQRRFFERLDAELHNLYGPTEAAVDVSYWQCRRDDSASVVPIGRPIANLQLYVLDGNLEPVPIGVAGELHIGGVGVARGYHNRPELTAEKFISNPFEGVCESKLYKTGDLARFRPDGAIEYLGRLDHQIKIRGIRLELGEIEATLCAHPAVRECVVTVAGASSAEYRLIAYVVGATEEGDSVALRSYARKRLPDYAIPSTVVWLAGLPLSPNGKVDRRALPEPATTRQDHGSNYVPPRDEVERELAATWESILGIQPIGVRDDFFELGGHSLVAVKVMAEVEKRFGVNFELATLFRSPTVEQFAGILRQRSDPMPWSPLVPIQPRGSRRPFFCVAGGGGNVLYYYDLARHLGPEQPFYGLQARGLAGDVPPFHAVEEMAHHCVVAIRSVQPKGPYLLGGHCFGGLVALEIARLLVADGEEIQLVAAIDVPAPLAANPTPVADWDDAAWTAKIASALAHASGSPPPLKSEEELRTLSSHDQLDYLRHCMEEGGLLPAASGVSQVRGFVEVFKANSRTQYLPARDTRVPLAVFRATEIHPDYDYSAAEDAGVPAGTSSLGWQAFAADQAEVHPVPGNHLTMLNRANAPVLASRLTACLAKVHTLSQANLVLV